jgi:PTS system nitrogen regulatory IIA component
VKRRELLTVAGADGETFCQRQVSVLTRRKLPRNIRSPARVVMNLRKVLSVETVATELKATTKEGVIEELVDLLVAAGKIKDRLEALRAVLEREKKMSTGMQSGIAIPHGKTDVVEGLIAAFGMKHAGVNFEALDGQPSRIFVMTLSPVNRTGPHIQFLAEVSRQLNEPAIRERLLQATTAEDVLNIIAG